MNDSRMRTRHIDDTLHIESEGPAMKLSIRNQLAGEVVSVTLGAVNATIKVRLDGGDAGRTCDQRQG